MKLTYKIMLVAVLGAGLAATADAATQNITVTNKLSKSMPVSVTFAAKQSSTQTRPKKKNIRHNETFTVAQPADRNWVVVTVYEDTGYKATKKQAVLNITEPMYSSKRNITIDGVSSNPHIYLNDIDLTPDFMM